MLSGRFYSGARKGFAQATCNNSRGRTQRKSVLCKIPLICIDQDCAVGSLHLACLHDGCDGNDVERSADLVPLLEIFLPERM